MAMDDFMERLTIDITAKTHYAMINFLKKHGEDSHDISRFIEDAIIWRMMDREMAFMHAKEGEEVQVFSSPNHPDTFAD